MAAKHSPELPTLPMFDAGTLLAAATRQTELWRDAQTAALDFWQASIDRWFAHGRQSIAAAHEALSGIGECKDVGQLTALQQKWLAGALGRIATDVQTVTEASASCWNVAREAERGAAPSPAAKRAREEHRVIATEAS